MRAEDEFNFSLTDTCEERDWREFFSTKCWKELCDNVKARLVLHRNDLEVCLPEEFSKLQGQCLEDRFFLEYETLVMSEFKQKQKEESNG